jgi:hypothetical protein
LDQEWRGADEAALEGFAHQELGHVGAGDSTPEGDSRR